ncbi:Dimethylamine methyltransferase MtbB3 (fragment) [Syntrophaceticus schinkii]|uniref:Dimethylamine methyltransferase MtbB3 n=1 Tax=Syntrophaceticus schinkii TaxID=499207 RepID=A0A0B7ML93_9FIRM
MEKVFTRMGDGSAVWLSKEEVRHELEEGANDAADRGKIPSLTQEELDNLFDICTRPEKIVSVDRGNEVIVTFDAGTLKMVRIGVPVHRSQSIHIHERALGSDTMELAHIDYSYKAIKPIVHEEMYDMEQAQLATIIPLFYGAMPNVGLYTQPDGPVPNWSELLPLGKIAEAQAAQEDAVTHAEKDMVYVGSNLYEAGADGINFDTTGASGDADFLATLRAIRALKEKYPELPIEMGMSGEFVLGMHGELYFDDVRLAGLYPHDQVKVAEKAGVTIFGAVVNTNSSKSFPWNIARAVTFVKACTEAAIIPVHVNVGMGVGAIPVFDTPPPDVVSRASKALVEIGKADGL